MSIVAIGEAQTQRPPFHSLYPIEVHLYQYPNFGWSETRWSIFPSTRSPANMISDPVSFKDTCTLFTHPAINYQPKKLAYFCSATTPTLNFLPGLPLITLTLTKKNHLLLVLPLQFIQIYVVARLYFYSALRTRICFLPNPRPMCICPSSIPDSGPRWALRRGRCRSVFLILPR